MPTATKAPAKKAAAKKSSAKTAGNKTSTSKSTQGAKQTSRCWPCFEPVPGKDPGEKGSCKPKKNQTPVEKKADSRAAAASKQH